MEDEQFRSGVISLVTLIVIVLLVVGCVLVQKYAHADKNGEVRYEPATEDRIPRSEHTEKTVEHGILLIYARTNWAEGVDFWGSFLDVNGGVYEYDFPNPDDCFWKEPPELEDEATFVRTLEEIRKTQEPVKTVNTEVVNKVRKIGCKIDLSADYYMVREAMSCDYGDEWLIFCHPETKEFVLLDNHGDNYLRLEDYHAKKLTEMYMAGEIYDIY